MVASTPEKKKRRKGPGAPLMVRMAEDMLAQVDRFRRKEADMPSRAEAVRRLVQKGLRVN